MLENAINLAFIYVLVFFRVAGMMVWAPLLGSDLIPKRVKALVACVLAAGMTPGIRISAVLPQTTWQWVIAIGGEIVFGLAMGMVVSFIFVAVQWAGEMMGQQMGLNLGQTFDPEFSASGSMIGQVYFFLALVIFLCIGGHREMLKGVYNSFATTPLLSVGITTDLFSFLTGVLRGATVLAMRLSAPVLVSMLVVDVVLGFVGKTVPQLNIMTAGIAMRSLVGMVVLVLGMSLASNVIRDALVDSLRNAYHAYAPN